MTNTNLIRCGRVPFSAVRAATADLLGTSSELASSAAELGMIAEVGPWAVRLREGRRTAMEVYEYGELLDVVVESSLGGSGLRGARRGPAGRPGGGPVSCAWGRLPPCGAPPSVHFLAGGLRRRPTGADTVRTAGRFWFGSVAGEFRWARLPAAVGCACAGRPIQGRAA
ncbi:hypothetical protein HUT16_10845 [Kitasatospora sp. NA04385]|uniref:hypothetical protein n=1 Tax=Kitasatospora sp. NA04385 TaxID=2742135 RepID=UPI0015902C4F|nr:hypothetical protein [Kitasatospora sp. NA04385]QKW19496.1 hypothetical protein HUT16_10845 [Kitasatospora sp. NA04385]